MSAPTLRWADATGAIVPGVSGPLYNPFYFDGNGDVWAVDDVNLFSLAPVIGGATGLRYTSMDCSGTAYITHGATQAWAPRYTFRINGTAEVRVRADASQPVQVALCSFRPAAGGACAVNQPCPEVVAAVPLSETRVVVPPSVTVLAPIHPVLAP